MRLCLPRTAAAPLVLSVLLAGVAAAQAASQAPGSGSPVVPAGSTRDAKKAMTVEDYTKWKSINTSSISSDGKWVTYVLAFTNTLPADSKPVMHLLRLD